MSPIRSKVLAEVEDAAQSFRIARRLGVAQTSVQSALRWLRENGFVVCDGRWRLTDSGRAYLQGLRS